MGYRKETSYMVDNEIDLIIMNIALGNECCNLEEEKKELTLKIAEIEDKIIKKIGNGNKNKGFLKTMLC